ncbi:MAG TPA: hypothetical protein VFE24_17340 [Pirellulales bacterium]|jgi:hypothetical protein|nr:hypothetical protein [Pirellulales bacterium]
MFFWFALGIEFCMTVAEQGAAAVRRGPGRVAFVAVAMPAMAAALRGLTGGWLAPLAWMAALSGYAVAWAVYRALGEFRTTFQICHGPQPREGDKRAAQ